MSETNLKNKGSYHRASRDSVLTQIKMPNGRIVEKVNKDTIGRALNSAGKISAAQGKKK